MSTTLIFLVPIGLLAVAGSLCFVGCVFQTGGIEAPYSNNVINTQGLLAYWPLGDVPSAPTPLQGALQNSQSLGTATDLSPNNHRDGTYIVPPLYPDPPIMQSAKITNPAMMLNLRQGSIVPGDVSQNGIVDQNLFPGSTDFEGGYVSIPWSTLNGPTLDQFTFEAWIKPHWTGTGVVHVLFGALASDGTGFVIAVEDTNNFFQFIIGNGSAGMPFTTDVQLDLTRPTATYLAVTFDPSNNGTVSLWVNPQAVGDTNPPTPPQANWSKQGTNYAATNPGQQQVTFFIGAGRNAQAPRTQNFDPNGAPEFPFQGQIQSVALYGTLLSASDILGNFVGGSTAP